MRVDGTGMASTALGRTGFGVSDALDLLDWKRRIFALYEVVRATAETDPEAAWRIWRDTREEMYRTHSQSPLPAARRSSYGNAFFRYDPAFRVVAETVEEPPAQDGAGTLVPASTGGTFAFTRIGLARFSLEGDRHELELHWNEGYGGGVLLAVADETSGEDTYGGGRYVLDTVKGADLGAAGAGLIVDFNFAYNPSCAFDSHWSCPLAPPANRLPVALRVGERAPR
jgi:uncharacterized protein (DUF1684 family)